MQTTQHGATGLWARAVGGTVLIAIGLFILIVAWSYPLGTVTQMGPGFIPRCVAIAIILLGVVVLVIDLRSAHFVGVERPQWRGILFITAAVSVFGVLVNGLGLVPAMFLAVAISMFADNQARSPGILLYAAIVTFLGWLLFIPALGLPLSAFGR